MQRWKLDAFCINLQKLILFLVAEDDNNNDGGNATRSILYQITISLTTLHAA